MNYFEQKVSEGKVRMLDSKVLIRSVSFIEHAKKTGGTAIEMLDIHNAKDANALYYIVVAKGPKATGVDVGDCVQHVDAAADKLEGNKYSIVDEKFIRCIFDE